MSNEKAVDPCSFWDIKQSVTSKLYHYLLRDLRSGNKVLLKQTKAATTLGCNRHSIKRAVDNMLTAKVIVFIEKDGHNSDYMVNPEFVWKGDGKYHEDGIRRFIRLCEGQESRSRDNG